MEASGLAHLCIIGDDNNLLLGATAKQLTQHFREDGQLATPTNNHTLSVWIIASGK